ncbi:DUF956 family protein [Pediococcus stilesii]|uniref:DUF956 family protein n=1 Tax=Pediococcus stilesii TaxID=331679 RepID=A0A0R2KV12_9LACO|nr:DUF956 family protein [Pediococcus stilesii]KRN93329.1 hypothetical protein IV81_GL000611 [Pediococcus stilesii]TLQ03980.1 DUF956 family protein [Pediococcus stilesii]
MAQSINTRADLVTNATSFLGMGDYGKIMIGDRGFEFFDNRNVENYIQIPWEEIDMVIASLMFGGRWIPRFAIKTKSNGTFSFAARKPHKVLREVRKHVDPNKMVRSLGIVQVAKNGLMTLFKRKTK